jgi:hypothetical protein
MKNTFFTKLFRFSFFKSSTKSCLKNNKNIKENLTGIKFDYTENDLSVYFEVADKKLAEEILSEIDFIRNMKNMKYGFILDIYPQQIPEIVSSLLAVNIPIYAIIPQKSNH